MSNNNVFIQKSDFYITVNKKGGKILANDPITVKNQIREIRSLDDFPGVNTAGRVDGSTFVYNANTFEYEVRQINVLSNLDVANITLHTLWANGSSGGEDQVLASNGTQVWWQNAVTTVYAGNGLSGGGKGAANVVLSLDSDYIRTYITANDTIHAYGKTEDRLSVESAVFAINANFSYTSNNTTYLNGKTEDTLEVQFAVLSVNSNFAYTANVANYAPLANSSLFSLNSNNSTYLNGQQSAFFTNASNMQTGTIPNERLPILDGGFF